MLEKNKEQKERMIKPRRERKKEEEKRTKRNRGRDRAIKECDACFDRAFGLFLFFTFYLINICFQWTNLGMPFKRNISSKHSWRFVHDKVADDRIRIETTGLSAL